MKRSFVLCITLVVATPAFAEQQNQDALRVRGSATRDGEEREPRLELDLGVRLFSRRLRFTNDLFERFRDHAVGGPALAAEASIYRWRHVGVIGRGHYAFGLSTASDSGEHYATKSYSGQGGVTTRFTFGPVITGAALLLGIDHTGLAASDTPFGYVESTYRYLRPEAYARATLGPGLEAFASAAYMILLSAGELSTTYFERLTGAGFAASSGLRYEIYDGLMALASVDYRRFFFAMDARPGDKFVVGGAADDQLGATLGFSYRL